MSLPNPLRVVLAEDHQVVREGLRALLARVPDILVVGEAADGAEAIAAVAGLDPDVLVLDLVLPTLGGQSVLQRLGAQGTRTAVVVLSAHDEARYVVEALKAGALGYVVKTAAWAELVHALHEVCAGRRYVSPSLSEEALALYATQQAAARRHLPLSPRQLDVITLSVQGLSLAHVAERLSISPRTAETHRRVSMRKLGLRTQTDLVRWAMRSGLISPER